jgi:GTPase SAR1 family protein
MAKEEQFDLLFKILLIGDSGVGKSSLVRRFVDDVFDDDMAATIGTAVARDVIVAHLP